MHLKTWTVINEVSSQTQLGNANRQESCQAKTSQATPTSQPQDLSQSKPQISIYFFKPVNVFSMCECVRTRAPLGARLCYLRSSQTESFTPGGSLVPPLCRTHSVYSHANTINVADDRGLGGMWRWAAKLQCHYLIPGMPRCTADGWRTPEHRKDPAIQASLRSLQLKAGFECWKRDNRAGISQGTEQADTINSPAHPFLTKRNRVFSKSSTAE